MKRGAIMFSSMGYHTLAISMGLTQAEADMLLNDFKTFLPLNHMHVLTLQMFAF